MAIIHPSFNLVAHPGLSRYPTFITATGNGTMLNTQSSQILENVTDGMVPRHDFDTETGEYNGILIERALAYSATELPITEALRRTTGGFSTLTAIASGGSGLTSGTYGSTLASGATAARTFTGLTSSGYYTFSVYCKSDSATSTVTLARSAGSPLSAYTGSYTVTNSAWKRLVITARAVSGSLTITLVNTTAGTVRFDGFQLEAGDLSSFVMTDRIDTNLQVTTSPKTFNAEQGTLYFKFKLSQNDRYIPGSLATLAYMGHNTVGASTLNLLIQIKKGDSSSSASPTPAYISVGRFDTATTSSPNYYLSDQQLYSASSTTLIHKVAVAYRESKPAKISINGRAVVTGGTNFPTPSAVYGVLRIGSSGTNKVTNAGLAPPLDAALQHFAYFPRMLDDADLISLTS